MTSQYEQYMTSSLASELSIDVGNIMNHIDKRELSPSMASDRFVNLEASVSGLKSQLDLLLSRIPPPKIAPKVQETHPKNVNPTDVSNKLQSVCKDLDSLKQDMLEFMDPPAFSKKQQNNYIYSPREINVPTASSPFVLNSSNSESNIPRTSLNSSNGSNLYRGIPAHTSKGLNLSIQEYISSQIEIKLREYENTTLKEFAANLENRILQEVQALNNFKQVHWSRSTSRSHSRASSAKPSEISTKDEYEQDTEKLLKKLKQRLLEKTKIIRQLEQDIAKAAESNRSKDITPIHSRSPSKNPLKSSIRKSSVYKPTVASELKKKAFYP